MERVPFLRLVPASHPGGRRSVRMHLAESPPPLEHSRPRSPRQRPIRRSRTPQVRQILLIPLETSRTG
eukprot:4831408-Pyramimonas_sp.AAC.1